MEWKISIVAIAALLFFSGVLGAATTQAGNCYNAEERTQYQPLTDGNGSMQQIRNCYNTEERTQYQPSSGPNRLLQQLRNHICDMLGQCQGGADLIELTGVMTYDGTHFFIGDVELHFGPYAYITSVTSAVDYDDDIQLELIMSELLGLVDTTVTVEGRYQSDNWMSVFTINGEVYREPGQPVWVLQYEWNQQYGYGGNEQP